MFVEADHSVVFRRRAAMYLLPVEQKDGVCRSFEDEAELRMLCKDWQIAKKEEAGRQKKRRVGTENGCFRVVLHGKTWAKQSRPSAALV